MISRSRTSITTGIVDRSESVTQTDTIDDRLSPLNNTNMAQAALGLKCSETNVDLEKFSDLELEVMQRSNEVRKISKNIKKIYSISSLTL